MPQKDHLDHEYTCTASLLEASLYKRALDRGDHPDWRGRKSVGDMPGAVMHATIDKLDV